MTRHPYVVLDQNLCRDQGTVDALFRRSRLEGTGVLLPDTAILEFSKGSAYLTWRKSLEHLCKEPQFVFVGRGIGPMMTEEIQTGQPTRDVVNHELTAEFRRLLGGLKSGDDTRINQALANVARIIDREKRLRERHEANKAIVVGLRDHWKKTLPNADLRQLRNKDKPTFIRILAESGTASIVFHAAKNDGCSNETAFALTIGPSVYGHVVQALAAFALDWLSYDGLDGVKPDEITNDFYDLDYVCTATFCSGLVTKDKRPNRVYSGLIEALKRRQQQFEAIDQGEQHE